MWSSKQNDKCGIVDGLMKILKKWVADGGRVYPRYPLFGVNLDLIG